MGFLSLLRVSRTKSSGCLMDSEVCMCVCGEGGGGVVLMKKDQSGKNVFKNSPIRRYLQKTSAQGFRKRDLGMKSLE